MKLFLEQNPRWTRPPQKFELADGKAVIYTDPETDLWQRTYYGFQNDNAPVLQVKTSEQYFSFVVKTQFESKTMYDQCGIALYLNSDNWLKASVEYENQSYQRLGSVVTNHGYSDWASTDIDAAVNTMWYRLSRRKDDYCIECSTDGQNFQQMRILHLHEGAGEISFGIYACSPGKSSFKATFSQMQIGECQWQL